MTDTPPAVKYWVRDKHELGKGPTFANIASPDEAIQVVLAADYERLLSENERLRSEAGYHNAADVIKQLTEHRERLEREHAALLAELKEVHAAAKERTS